MLIAENDRPFLKCGYPVDIQGREHKVVGQPKSQGEAPFWIEDTDKLASSVMKMLICRASSVSKMLTSMLRQYSSVICLQALR